METVVLVERIAERTFREESVAVALVRGIEIQRPAEGVLAAGIGHRKVLWRMKGQEKILRKCKGRSEEQECDGQLHLSKN